jgi:hypothetical protein
MMVWPKLGENALTVVLEAVWRRKLSDDCSTVKDLFLDDGLVDRDLIVAGFTDEI